VTQWYKDYKGYKGVNRARTREECARLLKAEGYATDPVYSQKLIKIMNDND
jgi:flagellum-specific peptidoglycan hydrolase FlgJ